MHPLPSIPEDQFYAPVEFVDEVEGIYFRSIVLKNGEFVRQHVHDHSHATYCGNGAARMWVDGVWERDIVAGQAVAVAAGKAHAFLALADDTRLACVHDVHSAESIKQKEK